MRDNIMLRLTILQVFCTDQHAIQFVFGYDILVQFTFDPIV